jgi:hypothetical protein
MSDSSIRQRSLVLLALALVSCGGVQLGDGGPLRVELPGEAPEEKKADPEPTPAAPAPSAAPVTTKAVTTDPPDPPAQSASEQLDLFLVFERGTLLFERSESVTLKTAELTSRRLGRFAVELFDERGLIERVRFDFPLLADEADAGVEKGLRSEVRVRVPVLPEVTKLRVLDRKTRKVLDLDWGELRKGR